MYYARTWWGIIALAVLVPLSGQAVPGQAKTERTFVLSLRDYGWKPPERREISRPSIAIDSENRILVGFAVHEREGLVTRDQPSLAFRVVRFGRDGKADLSVSLPTIAGGRNGIYLSDADEIIARANDFMQLLQTDEGERQKVVWKILAPCPLRCQVGQSLTRRTLLLYTEEGGPATLIRLSQKPVLEQCGKAPQFIASTEDKIQNYPQSITDEFAYFHGWEPGSGAFTYRWPLCDYQHRVEIPLRVGGRWAVLNDDTFVVYPHSKQTGREGLEVISSRGQLKFQPTLLKDESAGMLSTPIRSSKRGDRIAVEVLTLRGGNRALDISNHITARRIAVYDTEAGTELASVPVGPKLHYPVEFDLSPDGKRLAILEDDTVNVVDLEQPR
jgi:hypothetical protein